MKQVQNSKTVTKRFFLHIFGVLLCVLPPAVCTLTYFPLWKYNAEKSLAGGALILLLLSAYPLFKLIKKWLASPSGYLLWLVIFVIFFLLSKIADEMTVISFFGFLGNLFGALVFKFSERSKDNEG